VHYREKVYPVIWATDGLWDWWKQTAGAVLHLPDEQPDTANTVQQKRNSGGRKKEWEKLWELMQEMKKADPTVSDAKIAAAYNKRYPRRRKATARTVRDVRYENTKRKRKQKH